MRKEREGEKIGGGVWIFKRNKKHGRIYPSPVPFEHPSLDSAITEAERLSKLHPQDEFIIVTQGASIIADVIEHVTPFAFTPEEGE